MKRIAALSRGQQGSFFVLYKKPDVTAARRFAQDDLSTLFWYQADGTRRVLYAMGQGEKCVWCDQSLAYDAARDRLLVRRQSYYSGPKRWGDEVIIQSLDYRWLAAHGAASQADTYHEPVVHKIQRQNVSFVNISYNTCFPGNLHLDHTDEPMYLLPDSSVRIARWAGCADYQDQFIATDLKAEAPQHEMSPGGLPLATRDPLTRTVTRRFEYDPAGDLSTVVESSGLQVSLERDARGFLAAVIGPDGHRTEILRDAASRVSGVRNPLGETYVFTYIGDTQLLETLTDPEGETARFAYDGGGRLTRDTDASGGVQTLSVGAASNIITHEDADGVQTRYLRTSTELLKTLAVGHPDGTVATQVTDPGKGILTLYADGTRELEILEDDPVAGGQLPFVRHRELRLPSGRTINTYQWRSASIHGANLVRRRATAFALGDMKKRWFLEEDLEEGSAELVSPVGRRALARRNAAGQVTQLQVGNLLPVSFAYDDKGRVASIAQGERNTTITYGENGRSSVLIGPDGRTFERSFDASARLTGVTGPDGTEVGFRYDGVGRVLGVEPPGRPEHSWSRSPVGQVTGYQAPGFGLESFRYTPGRRQERTTLASGEAVIASHNDAGQLRSLVLPTGQRSYGYHNGRLRSATAVRGLNVMNWHDGPLLREILYDGLTAIQFGYDNLLRLTQVSVGSTYLQHMGYDDDGRVKQVLLNGLANSPSVDVEWRGRGYKLSKMGVLGSEYRLEYSEYGELRRLEALGNFGVNRLYSVSSIVRDLAGRVRSEQEEVLGEVHTREYTYDASGRLQEVKLDGLISATYEYDLNGNRLARRAPGSVEEGTYNDGDVVLTYGDYAYTIDANGRYKLRTDLSTGEATGFEYDVLGSLRAVELADGTQIEYELDAFGRRHAKRVDGVVEKRWVYANHVTPLAEVDASGNMLAGFVYVGSSSVPGFMVKDGDVYQLISDARHSIRLVVNVGTGDIAQRIDYDEFGRVLTDTNAGFQPFGFAGGLYDPDTGLVRFGARDYDAYTGRWTARDPILFHGGQANLYAYVNNDPVNFIDPTGLRCSYWDRVMQNWRDTNEMLPGLLAPTGVGFITGGAVANALGVPSLGTLGRAAATGAYVWGESAIAGGAGLGATAATAAEGATVVVGSTSAGGVAGALGGAAVASATNFLVAGFAWEAGAFAGSLIAAALPWGPNGSGESSVCGQGCD